MWGTFHVSAYSVSGEDKVKFKARQDSHMTKIALAFAIAAPVLMSAPSIVGVIPANAQDLKVAQGVDVQIGRDRDYDRDRGRRYDRDTTVGIGPGGVTVGPRQHCRTETVTIERGGRMITRRERRCD
jgi:hypothetical protein